MRSAMRGCTCGFIASARSALAIGMLLGVLLFPGVARASEYEGPPRVEWSPSWPRARWWEVVDVVALAAASEEINDQWPTPSSARWKGGILFDDWARGVFRGRSAQMQLAASTLGDYLYLFFIGWEKFLCLASVNFR